MRTFQEHLISMDACAPASAWVGDRTPREAWEECPNPGWMLWYMSRVGVPNHLLVRAACACARLELPYIPLDEKRPEYAIFVAEGWTRGLYSLDALGGARLAADSAIYSCRLLPYSASYNRAVGAATSTERPSSRASMARTWKASSSNG